MFTSARASCCCSVVVTALVCVQSASAQTPGPPPSATPADLVTPADRIAVPAPAPAALTRPSVLRDLFGGTVRDIRRLPSKTTVAWLGVGLIMAGASRFADSNVTEELTESPSLARTFHAGQTLGGVTGQLGGAFATYVVGRATHHEKLAGVGGELFRAQMISQGITQGIKMSVQRTRPDGTRYSFPSGHTSTTFASATVLQREYGWKVGVPAYALATYVAASRVQTKRHYLSDVAFGAAIGILAGRTVTVGHGDARFALAPIAAPGGAGIGFTLVGSR